MAGVGWGVLQGWTNDQFMPGGEFHKCICRSNEDCKSVSFPQPWWDIHL